MRIVEPVLKIYFHMPPPPSLRKMLNISTEIICYKVHHVYYLSQTETVPDSPPVSGDVTAGLLAAGGGLGGEQGAAPQYTSRHTGRHVDTGRQTKDDISTLGRKLISYPDTSNKKINGHLFI